MSDMSLTLISLTVCAVLGSFSFYKHFEKRETYKAPIIPWIIPSIACIATGFMLLVHLVNLLGIETGR